MLPGIIGVIAGNCNMNGDGANFSLQLYLFRSYSAPVLLTEPPITAFDSSVGIEVAKHSFLFKFHSESFVSRIELTGRGNFSSACWFTLNSCQRLHFADHFRLSKGCAYVEDDTNMRKRVKYINM